ncbi:MAG: pyridoxamine 5'-phosphate oxidase family protein [Vicinamibacterales bacterium]
MAERTREEAIRTLAAMIADIPVAMLTTTNPRGWLRSRPMVVQEEPFDGTLWFFTSGNAAKAADIRDRRQVNVSFAAPYRDRYVSVSGVAAVIDDADLRRRLWNESYRPWFPQGLDDPDLRLIKIEAEEAEYWDPAEGRMVHVPELYVPKPGFGQMQPETGI